MVSHPDHKRESEALNPSLVPSHIIFPAKTRVQSPASPASPAFAG